MVTGLETLETILKKKKQRYMDSATLKTNLEYHRQISTQRLLGITQLGGTRKGTHEVRGASRQGLDRRGGGVG